MKQEEETSRARIRWYKEAVIYQAHVRAFLDSTADGVGDFHGLTSRLDYLEALGINTLWLLPFYPSPLKDDGYDIADYENIHPAYGTLEDFDRFVAEAHRRHIRVVTELVINHTSDAHPWFQAARRAPAVSPARDFYVWSDTHLKSRACRSSSRTPRSRTGPGTRPPAQQLALPRSLRVLLSSRRGRG